jgi:hypothetical protein
MMLVVTSNIPTEFTLNLPTFIGTKPVWLLLKLILMQWI